MVRRALVKRLEKVEEAGKALSRNQPSHFDDDAFTIYCAMSYLDATMAPTYDDVQTTAAYVRGKELRDARYGPIVTAHLNEHLKRYTRASGEFELAFGREPKAGDILWYEHVAMMHSSENYSRHFGRIVEAWQRNLSGIVCPLRFEDGRLFRRLVPEKRGAEAKWEEDIRIQPQMRWLSIPEVWADADFDANHVVAAVMFEGVVGVKHQCRPATREEFRQVQTELAAQEPTLFMLGRQRFNELLVEVFGQ